jgi:hypothetical protein
MCVPFVLIFSDRIFLYRLIDIYDIHGRTALFSCSVMTFLGCFNVNFAFSGSISVSIEVYFNNRFPEMRWKT